MPLNTETRTQSNVYLRKEEKLFLYLEAHFYDRPYATHLGMVVNNHIQRQTTDFRKYHPRKIVESQLNSQAKRQVFQDAWRLMENILLDEFEPENYYSNLDSLLLEAKGEWVSKPLHFQFPEDVRDLFPPMKNRPIKEDSQMAIKTPPNDFIVLSHGKDNAKSETLKKTGEPNIRHGHIVAIGPDGHRQTVAQLEEAAPKAKMNLRWEIRDGYCSILNPETGEDVSEEFAAPGNRRMDDPEWEAKRAAAKAKRDAKAAEKKAAKAQKAESTPSPVGDLPDAHEDNPDDVEDCVNFLVTSHGMPEDTARQVVRDNGVAATYEQFRDEDVEGDGEEDGVEGDV